MASAAMAKQRAAYARKHQRHEKKKRNGVALTYQLEASINNHGSVSAYGISSVNNARMAKAYGGAAWRHGGICVTASSYRSVAASASK